MDYWTWMNDWKVKAVYMVSVHSQRQQQVSTTHLLWFNQHSTCSRNNSTAVKRKNQDCGKSWLVRWKTAHHALQPTTGQVYMEEGRSKVISNISRRPFAMVSSVWLDNNTPLRLEPSSWFISFVWKIGAHWKTRWQDYRRWPPIVYVLSMLRLSVPAEDSRGDINSKPASVFTISTGLPKGFELHKELDVVPEMRAVYICGWTYWSSSMCRFTMGPFLFLSINADLRSISDKPGLVIFTHFNTEKFQLLNSKVDKKK